LTDDIDREINKYKVLGISKTENGHYLGMAYKSIKIGKNHVYFLEKIKSGVLNTHLTTPNISGICGFQIKVNSLKTLNKASKQKKHIKIEWGKSIVFLHEYNMFLEFIR
jgi:hypothetical protein